MNVQAVVTNVVLERESCLRERERERERERGRARERDVLTHYMSNNPLQMEVQNWGDQIFRFLLSVSLFTSSAF